MTDAPRLAPISDADWPDGIADLNAGFAGALNVYRTMAHHPDLVRAWAPLRQHIVKDTSLGPVLSEVVILRTGVRLKSDYEWAHHVTRSRALGMSDDRIRAVQGSGLEEDRTLIAAVDALFDQHRLPSSLERELSETIGTDGVLDLIATVGFYRILGAILMTYEVPVDDAVAAEMASNPI